MSEHLTTAGPTGAHQAGGSAAALIEALTPLDRLGEDPVDTVRRECREELAVEARFHPALGSRPLFLTVTDTSGADPHRDVSLWFVLEASRSTVFHADPGEYRSIRWWTADDIRVADPAAFDPHMRRMLDKVEATIWP